MTKKIEDRAIHLYQRANGLYKGRVINKWHSLDSATQDLWIELAQAVEAEILEARIEELEMVLELKQEQKQDDILSTYELVEMAIKEFQAQLAALRGKK